MIKEKRYLVFIILTNQLLQSFIVTILGNMIFLLVFLNDFSTYSALRGVSVACNSMCCYLRCLYHLLAIRTEHWLCLFILLIRVLLFLCGFPTLGLSTLLGTSNTSTLSFRRFK
jgi:hypothetical protein